MLKRCTAAKIQYYSSVSWFLIPMTGDIIYSEFALTISIPLVEVLQISFCHAQSVFCPMHSHLVKIMI